MMALRMPMPTEHQAGRKSGGLCRDLDQVMALLRQRGRMTYRTLQRQFQLDDDALHDLTEELLYAHPEVRDDAGRGLVWTGDAGTAPAAPAAPVEPPGQVPPPTPRLTSQRRS